MTDALLTVTIMPIFIMYLKLRLVIKNQMNMTVLSLIINQLTRSGVQVQCEMGWMMFQRYTEVMIDPTMLHQTNNMTLKIL